MLRPVILLGCHSYLWSLSHWEAGVIKQLIPSGVSAGYWVRGLARDIADTTTHVPTAINTTVERECHNVGTPYTHQIC